MIDSEDEDQIDYGPNAMVDLKYSNRAKYDRIMAQNIGDQQSIDRWHEKNLEESKTGFSESKT